MRISKQPNIYAIPLAIAAVVSVGIFLHFISDAFLTFVAALFLANIVMPLVALLQKKKVPMVLVILLVLTVVTIVLFGLIIVIASSISSIIEVLPHCQQRWDRVLLPAFYEVLNRVSQVSSAGLLSFCLLCYLSWHRTEHFG